MSSTLRIAGAAAAGFLATIPMTIAMQKMFEQLPKAEQYPLPPRIITEKVTEKIGVKQELEQARIMLPTTWVAHFTFGAAVGALYGALNLGKNRIRNGILYGLGVYGSCYAGILPLTGLFPAPGRQPIERNLLMIVAHVVWGGSLAKLNQVVNPNANESDDKHHIVLGV